GYLCDYTYTIDSRGELLLEVHGTPHGEQPPTLPRIGLQLGLVQSLANATWFGRGPGESYPDTKKAARLGLFSGTIDDLHTPYIYPQENGNRSDCRWISLTDARGVGLLVTGTPTID